MAITILFIPAESAEAERAFFGARRTCSWEILRLKCVTTELTECIGNWLREGHILPLSQNGLGLLMSPASDDRMEELDDEWMDVIEWLQIDIILDSKA
jgi:hypothetical protein